ncbi:MAG: UDP-N-acetylmuramate--alanine ligase [Chlorobiaceae bacterium]|nr:UDP-N-acetylmuramate--alanine ligase [Chlorobiaceae bacterium]NTW10513.1 UDP-N-acetylmuramate--alanine ligase [Chlorobiaceae bacterium]
MSSIYFIGIGGTAMASTAVALSHEGHAITGSDTQLYPPMSTYLEEHNIRYFNGFSEHNLQSASPDIIVVGNAISRGNPELEYALEHRLELVSMPDLVRRTLIGTNTSIVVTGTHGKTTTTSLVAWLLEYGGLKPGFLVGGIPENFSIGCRASGRETEGFFVSEGDEYDTAFFDKRSKFLHYRPDIAIINNIEFDHADIFSSLEEIRRSFRLFVNLIPRNGTLIVNGEDPVALEVASKAFCRVERFGLSGECEWLALNVIADHDSTSFDILRFGKFEGTVRVPLFGNYNIMNSLAAVAAAMSAGLPFEAVSRGLSLFRRPKRRMEVIGTFNRNITLLEDFAHHPTAVRVTLEAIGQLYEGRRIVTCFEPRSNTTTRNIFQKELSECFSPAAVVVFGKVHRPERYSMDERLDTDMLEMELKKQGKTVFMAGRDTGDYPVDIVRFLDGCLREGDVVVVLSNGSFGNLKNLLVESFKK